MLVIALADAFSLRNSNSSSCIALSTTLLEFLFLTKPKSNVILYECRETSLSRVWKPVAESILMKHAGKRRCEVVTRRTSRMLWVVSFSINSAVVNDEWTSVVKHIFWQFRCKISVKNTSPRKLDANEEDWSKTSFGKKLRALHWLRWSTTWFMITLLLILKKRWLKTSLRRVLKSVLKSVSCRDHCSYAGKKLVGDYK